MDEMEGMGRHAGVLVGLLLLASLTAGCGLLATEPPITSPPTEILTPISTVSVPQVEGEVATVPPIPEPTIVPISPVPKEGRIMSLTIVFDNNPFDPHLRVGWGFSAWLDLNGTTVLFDTGADGTVLLDNMAALGLDPLDIEVVVLSHIHGDHTGGLAALLAVNPQVTVYLPRAFPTRFKDQVQEAGATVVEVGSPVEILPGLWTTGQMGDGITEQGLVVSTAQGLVVITGCAHPGVDRMAARAREVGQDDIHLVIGGFHLGGASRRRIEEIIDGFRRLGVQNVAPCHCTGDKARGLFREAYGTGFYAIGVGWQWQGQALLWRPVNHGIPAQIGVASVAIAPSDPEVIYLAAYEPGGLYRSVDGGDSWQPASGGLESLAPLSMAVHPTDPNTAWVGTLVGGYHTADGGQMWQPMTALPRTPLYTLTLAPDGQTLYAGGEGTGLWCSDDGGHTWEQRKSVLEEATILSFAVTMDGSLFAGTAGQGIWVSRDGGERWQAAGAELAAIPVPILAATQDGRLYALADGDLYLSRDEGNSWLMVGPPDLETLSLAIEPGSSGRLYLGGKDGRLAVSRDGGQSWTFTGEDLRHADLTWLAADPVRAGQAYLGTRHNGLYRTADGGKSWTLISGQVGQPLVTALAQHPQNAQTYYAGTMDGVYRSEDGGETWTLVSGAEGKVFVQGLAMSPGGRSIYAGARTGVYVSEDGGTRWRWATEQLGTVSVFAVAVDPHDEDKIYAGCWGHNILRSTDGGGSWASIHHGLETLSVHAFALDPTHPHMLYAGTVEAIYRSTDGGESWQAVSPSNRHITTFALAVDPTQPGLVYAGTTEGVYRSADHGQTWGTIGHSSLAWTVTALGLSPTDTQVLYAGTEHQGLFRSIDGGQQWQPWGPADASVYAILPDRDGTVWVGTDKGIFRNR